jgi:tetratricopeptide (TPR) repeat protein
MGAVMATKAQLSAYVADEWMIPDSVLRTDSPGLLEAEEWYRRALDADPGNATANRRLGQIAFARGDYESSFDYFQAALTDPFASRMTLQYLAELYALQGNPKQAVAIWRMLDSSQGQLDERDWWYLYEVDDPIQTERFESALKLLAETE